MSSPAIGTQRSGRRRLAGIGRVVSRWERQIPLVPKLAIALVLVTVLTAGVSGWAVSAAIRDGFADQEAERARQLADLVGEQSTEDGTAELEERLRHVQAAVPLVLRLRLYRPVDGTAVIAASSVPGEAGGVAPADAITAPLRTGVAVQTERDTGSPQGRVLETVEPIRMDGDVIAAVAVSTSVAGREAAVADVTRRARLIGAAGALAEIAVLGLILGVLVVRRARRLSEAARRVAAGDLSALAANGERGRDELLQVAAEFDQMVHALALSERRFQRLVETVPAITYIRTVDEPSVPTYVSPQVERYLGFPSAAWTNDPELWGRRLHPDDAERVTSALHHHQATGEPFDREYRMIARDGGIRWIHDIAAMVHDDEGRPAYTQGVATDITRTRTAETALAEQRATLDAVVEASPVVMVSVGLDGRNRFVSPAVRTVGGREPAELQGQPALRYFHPDDVPDAVQGFEDMVAGRTAGYRGLLRYQRADGSWATLDCRGEIVRDDTGQPTGLVYAMSDVTDTVRLTEELQAAMEAAEAANHAKSEFLSRMSHELRTPLNAVLGFAQLLEMGDLDAEQRESIAQILGAGEHLLHLIDDALEISRIEAGALALSLEPVAVGALVGEVVDLLRPAAAERDVDVEADQITALDAVVTADRQGLRQVLLNLVGNAIKYNRAGGRVAVSCTPVGDGRLRLAVTDTGPGIAPDLLERLFTPFDRLDAGAQVPGTGLGLAVSERLTDAMGGSIGVESTPGQGSTFWAELPAAHPDAAPYVDGSNAPPVPTDTGTAGRVLYIEDNPSNVLLLQRLLERFPRIQLRSADRGQAGLQIARQERPGLVLLDLGLPDLPGEEVLRELRAYPTTSRIPVVVLTADATAHRVAQLRTLGADDYLTKPLDVRKVLATLARHLHVQPPPRA